MKSSFILFVLYVFAFVFPQEGLSRRGIPLMKHYGEEEMQSYPTVRWISKDAQGILYFANKNGIVRYNGEFWDEIPTFTPASCVAVDNKTNVIYVGGKEDFGMIIPNDQGKLTYKSLVRALTKKERENLQNVDRVFVTEGKAFFAPTGNKFVYIVKYTGGKLPNVSVKEFEDIIIGSGKIGESVWVNVGNKGLYKYANGKWTFISDKFATNELSTIIGLGNGEGLIAEYHTGYLYKIKGRNIQRFFTQADEYLQKHKVYEATYLNDGRIAIATYSGGVVVLNKKTGNTEFILNKQAGLPDNDMYFVFGDHQVGLWAAHARGITHINTNLPVSSYAHLPGLEGKITDMQWFQNNLYVATQQGVFRFVGNKYEKVRNTNIEVWDLLEANGKLLVAATQGVFEISGGSARQILKGVTLRISPSEFNKNRVYVLSAFRVGLLKFTGGRWQFDKQLEGIREEVNSLVEKDVNTLMLGTDYKGILIYDLRNSKVQRVDLKKILGVRSNFAKVVKIKGTIYSILSNGVYYVDKAGNIVMEEKATELVRRYKMNPSKDLRIVGDALWLSTKQWALRIAILKQGKYNVEVRRPVFGKKIDVFYEDPEGRLWLGIHDQLYRFSRRKLESYKQKHPDFMDFSIVTSRISVGDSVIFYGYVLDENGYPTYDILKAKENWFFTNKENNLTFYLGATSYFNEELNEFQYKLEGSDEDWSDWTTEGKIDLRNLWEGDYKLLIRARNFMGKTVEKEVMKFTVSPPWWRHPGAYAGYAVLLILIVLGAIRINTMRLEARNRELQELVDQRTQEIRKQRDELERTLKELQATQAQLVQSEKLAALGQLVAGVAHEINTPLGAINAAATNLKNSLPEALKELPEIVSKLSPEEANLLKKVIATTMEYESQLTSREERKLKRALKGELEEAGISGSIAGDLVKIGLYESWKEFIPLLKHSEASRILKVITTLGKLNLNLNNILLAVAKTQKIVFALKSYSYRSSDEQKVPLNVEQNLDTVLTIYHNQLKQGIEVEMDIDDNLPEVQGYPDELNQVWTNIIHNAIQAMEGKGALKIGIKNQGNKVVVTITDNGPGIPKDIQEKIFEPFFTTKGQGEGSGLGLSIVKRIVEEKHGGKISVQSQPGETTFIVELPV